MSTTPAEYELGPLQQFLFLFDEDDNGCWIWQGKVHEATGYGRYTVARHTDYIHRLAYKQFIGPIPDGLTIDHLCRVRMCGNPDHLEAVDARTNILRGTGYSARAARRTHCPSGHPYDDINTQRPQAHPNWRRCRACARAHRLAYYYAKKEPK